MGRVGEDWEEKGDKVGLGRRNGREKGTGMGKIGRWGKTGFFNVNNNSN